MNTTPSRSPKVVGEMSEGIVIAHLLKLGYSVSIPFGNSQKYDLIVDTGTLLRVQVKTGRLAKGCVSFPTCARNTINGKRTSYHGHADLLLVYCPDTATVYSVSISDLTNNSAQMQLRVEPPRGPSLCTIRWAKDYEFPLGNGHV